MRHEKPTIAQVVDQYDLRPNRAGYICCPVHEERNPSCQLHDDWWYCHACGANGDSIGLIAAVTRRPLTDVLRDYTDKVATWRNRRTVTLPPREGTVLRAWRDLNAWFFRELARRLEGAPDWMLLRSVEYWGERFNEVRQLVSDREQRARAEVALRALAAECERGLDAEGMMFWDWVEGQLALRSAGG